MTQDEKKGEPQKPKTTPTVSTILADGSIVELVFDRRRNKTSLIVGKGDEWSVVRTIADGSVTRTPVPASNQLLQRGVVRVASMPKEYESEKQLVDEIAAYIHRYVDVSPRFERLASYYVLFTWLHDAFNELPYLRLRGDYGSGKTRFLLTVGAVCYKPIFASAASTVSPIFRLLDSFEGTLVIDEGDLHQSDEKADVVKILNNGNVRGFHVLRSESDASGVYSPRAFKVFGPKLVATRDYYEDRALESRFITEEMGRGKLRPDVPINLPHASSEEAQELRNKLLLYRLRTRPKATAQESFVDPKIEPRLNQIAVPLLSVIDDPAVRGEVHDLLREYNDDLVAQRGMDVEARVLEAVRACLVGFDRAIPVKEIARIFTLQNESELDQPATSKWVGTILRRRLHLKTRKSGGIYVLPVEERFRLRSLFDTYGLNSSDSA